MGAIRTPYASRRDRRTQPNRRDNMGEHDARKVIEMSNKKLSIDELAGRGLENIRDATDLLWAFNTIIRAVSKKASKESMIRIFDDSWAECRGD